MLYAYRPFQWPSLLHASPLHHAHSPLPCTPLVTAPCGQTDKLCKHYLSTTTVVGSNNSQSPPSQSGSTTAMTIMKTIFFSGTPLEGCDLGGMLPTFYQHARFRWNGDYIRVDIAVDRNWLFLCFCMKMESFICLLFTSNIMFRSYFVNFKIIVTPKYLKIVGQMVVKARFIVCCMCTARFSGHLSCMHPPSTTHTPPAMHTPCHSPLWTDRQLCKHYLSTTTVVGSNNSQSPLPSLDPLLQWQ